MIVSQCLLAWPRETCIRTVAVLRGVAGPAPLHRRGGHEDSPFRAADRHAQRCHLADRGRIRHRSARSSGHTDIVRLREGGVGAVFFAVYVAADLCERKPLRQSRAGDDRHGAARHRRRYPNDFVFAPTADDIEAAHRAGQDRRADGDRRRPCHRRQPAAAARLLSAGRALHDADAHQHQQLGRIRRATSDKPTSSSHNGPHRFRQSRWCGR